jgi:hypothetical protein
MAIKVKGTQTKSKGAESGEAAAEGFVAVLKALPKVQRDAIVVRLARDREIMEDLLDLALIESRKDESFRPLREYLRERRPQ